MLKNVSNVEESGQFWGKLAILGNNDIFIKSIQITYIILSNDVV